MKKNISINISGIIFHIEEDGYDRLNSYLESINKYFSHYEDSKEIIEDIESRIAEIFLAKLAEDKQVINAEDVDNLISTMGTIADFEATIDVDEEDLPKEEPVAAASQESTASESTTTSTTSGKKLVRDKNRKVLGGVAAGIAHYFNVDPIWIRLIFLALFINVFWGGVMGGVLLVYIILWIVLPEEELEEDTKVKKLYRDPEDRVLGGVASGLAAYFGADTTVIRLLFALSILLGGSGVVVYLVLWIITPEAQTITEKMQMQGEPVTLSNIETNIKKSLNVKEGEENAFVKILLFPFRLIAMIITGLGRALGPIMGFLLEAVRVFVGVILFIVGLSFAVSLIISLGAFFGIFGDWAEFMVMGDIPEPIIFIRGLVPDSGAFFGFLAGFIPALALMLAGLSIIVKKMVIKGYAVWSLLGLWLIGLIGLAITVPVTVGGFRKEAFVKETRTFKVDEGKTPVLNMNYLDKELSDVDLRLRGHSDSTYKLVLEYSARGRTRDEAKEYARMINYNVAVEDSVFTFDSDYKVINEEEFEFRFQEVDAIFYLPYNQVFKMDQDMDEILVNTLHLNGYSGYQIGGNEWVFTEEGITCLSCSTSDGSREKYIPNSSNRDFSIQKFSGEMSTYNYDNFTKIKANGLFEIELIQGDEYSINVKGPRRVMDDVDVYQNNGRLVFDYDGDWDWWRRRKRNLKVGVSIVMPTLEGVDLSGASKLYIRDFNAEEVFFDLSGASFCQVQLDASEVNMDLSGASKISIRGTSSELNGEISGASSLDAENLDANYVDIDATGASKAEVYGSQEITIDAGGASRVKYSGTRNANVSSGGGSRVTRSGN